MKNLILKQALPSVFLYGVEYKRPKGTVYRLVEEDERWDLLNGEESCNIIDQDDYEANKEWFGLTAKQPTYELYYIDGEVVEFHEGHITIGCQDVSNELIKKIAKNLK